METISTHTWHPLKARARGISPRRDFAEGKDVRDKACPPAGPYTKVPHPSPSSWPLRLNCCVTVFTGTLFAYSTIVTITKLRATIFQTLQSAIQSF